jgi:hypothetical protein
MRKVVGAVCLAVVALLVLSAGGQASKGRTTVLRLDSLEGLEAVNTRAEIVTYRGRKALHLTPPENPDANRESMMALVGGSDFKDGTIEAEIAGVPITAMDPTARGFVGIEFRMQEHAGRGEIFYLRPTNGRADDQLRRNHSAQYESIPDFPWYRLRKETPGVYESYVDLDAGAWTKVKIEVTGTKARLYVGGAEQPCLIVNDLKLGEGRGQIGLWGYIATEAYFSNLKVTQAN